MTKNETTKGNEMKAAKITLTNPHADKVRTDPKHREILRAVLKGMSASVIRNVYK